MSKPLSEEQVRLMIYRSRIRAQLFNAMLKVTGIAIDAAVAMGVEAALLTAELAKATLFETVMDSDGNIREIYKG